MAETTPSASFSAELLDGLLRVIVERYGLPRFNDVEHASHI